MLNKMILVNHSINPTELYMLSEQIYLQIMTKIYLDSTCIIFLNQNDKLLTLVFVTGFNIRHSNFYNKKINL